MLREDSLYTNKKKNPIFENVDDSHMNDARNIFFDNFCFFIHKCNFFNIDNEGGFVGYILSHLKEGLKISLKHC